LQLYRDRKFEDASAAFEKLAQTGGEDAPRAYAWLARTQLQLGNVTDAEAAARKSLSLSENLPTGHSALGEVYFREGRFPEAEQQFLMPLKAGIADPRAYYGEARLSWINSNYKHGKQLIDKARALDADDPEIQAFWRITLPPKAQSGGLAIQRHDDSAPDSTAKESLGERPKNSESNGAVQEPACRLVTSVTSTEVPLERLMLNYQLFRGFGLKVNVNDTPSTLALDTGASGITINTRLAERANVRRLKDTKIGGIGDAGPASGYLAMADTIQVGGLEFTGCKIYVLDKKRSMGEDGFIGSDVFQSFLVEINFPDEKLKLSELPKSPEATEQPLSLFSESYAPFGLRDRYIAPEMQSYERVYRIGHFLLIPTYVNTTGNTRLFLMDTGAYDINLDIEFARQVTRVHHDDFTTVKGISGRVKYVYRADAVKLGFPYSRLMQEVRNVTAFDISDQSQDCGIEISGIIGFSLLYLLDIKIDYRDGLVSFSYDPHRLH
jgi:predicted aspartyl protease